MSSEIAIKVNKLSKCYEIYNRPADRLKQFVVGSIQLRLGRKPPKFYREFWALRDISFEIRRGETVGIIGRNGSGKSTLLQIISEILTPTVGHVAVYGRVAALLELGAGFNPEFSGRENVFMRAAMFGLSAQQANEKFQKIADFAEIGDFIDQPIKHYSSGMYVRLAFALQISFDPEILIIDEALAVGDTYFVHRCMLYLRDLQSRNVTILFVSHSLDSVLQLCNRAIWIDQGNLIADDSADIVVNRYLSSVFKHREINIANHDKTNLIAQKKNVELNIPNIDRRVGTQEVKIIGVALYDDLDNQISTAIHGQKIILKISFTNIQSKFYDRLILGYIFRNSKGVNVASTHSQFENILLPHVKIKETCTANIKITLPILAPGNYAFTLGVSHIDPDTNEMVMDDSIENAIALNITSDKPVLAMMRFDSKYSDFYITSDN